MIVYAPRHLSKLLGTHSIFLGGSITGAIDWQEKVAPQLEDRNFTVYNPRRKNYDVGNIEMEKEQIRWEKYFLDYCDFLFFYFSKETVAPITLFEYGCYIKSDKKIIVYAHPEYPRLRDLLIQTELRNPDIFIHIKDLSEGLL